MTPTPARPNALRALLALALPFMLGLAMSSGWTAWAKCALPMLQQELTLIDAHGELPWPESASLDIIDYGDTFTVQADLEFEGDEGAIEYLILRSSGHQEGP